MPSDKAQNNSDTIQEESTQTERESKWISVWVWFKGFVKQNVIWLLLILGLVNGLVFVFVVPPWMHYDEPGHFEYAWLIANRPGFPERGDYDQRMRRQVSASIVEHNIEGYSGMVTDPSETEEPINIFLPQVEDHPPTYYALAAIPMSIFRYSDITFQLYLMRLVSLSLFLVLVWVGYRTCQLLFGVDHPLTWMVPLFLVTLPSFVDIMTAANNDVGANLAFSLFVWASVAAIKKGLSIWRLFAIFGGVILCLFTKSTAWLGAPLSLLVIVLALFRGKKYEKFVWLALGIGVIALVVVLFSWQGGAPAFYYGTNIQTNPDSIEINQAPLGQRVISQQGQGGRFYHMLSPEDRDRLGGGSATLGAWMWADAPTTVRFPGIRDEAIIKPIVSPAPVSTRPRLINLGPREVYRGEPISTNFQSDPIQLSTTPQFFAFSAELPPRGGDMSWVYFNPSGDAGVRVYWDGVVLVQGDFAEETPPEFDRPDGSVGVWGGVQFKNIIRNASGEQTWPVFADWINQYLDVPNRNVPSTSLILSIIDTQGVSLYYEYTVARVFRTFWGVFGWANVAMYGQKPYRLFFILTGIYLIGILVGLIRKSWNLIWQVFVFFSVALFLQLLMTVFRGVGSWFWTAYIPVGRYIYPAILPASILLVGGGDQVIRFAHKITRTSKIFLYSAYFILHAAIMLWAILSINVFYYGS